MMLVNYPNMPTGQTPSMELFQKIIDFGARHNILIVHDNPYSFIRNAEHPISIMEAEGAKDVALEMNSLSKGHSMAGWRVGVVVGKKEWIDSILTFKSNMDSGMFYPIQAAADTALALGEEWFKELNDIYYGREKQAYDCLLYTSISMMRRRKPPWPITLTIVADAPVFSSDKRIFSTVFLRPKIRFCGDLRNPQN